MKDRNWWRESSAIGAATAAHVIDDGLLAFIHLVHQVGGQLHSLLALGHQTLKLDHLKFSAGPRRCGGRQLLGLSGDWVVLGRFLRLRAGGSGGNQTESEDGGVAMMR